MLISSRENKLVKFVKKLGKKSFRDEAGLFVAEGERLVCDLYNKGARIKMIFVLEGKTFDASADEVYEITESVLSSMCETTNPQGILAVIEKPCFSIADIKEPLVILDKISDPGNLGTVIRTADSAGFGSVLLLKGTVDPFSPKVVRSTMGSLYGIPIISGDVSDLKNLNMEIVCADLQNSDDVFEHDFKKPFAIVIGNEANGVSSEVRELCNSRIKIPMLGTSESLNAAVSFAVVAYESVRQRRG